MHLICRLSTIAGFLAVLLSSLLPAQASPEGAFEHVVSVLPVWPGQQQGGAGATPGTAPEGSGVVVRPDLIATAYHVVEPAERIEIRLSDGRILPARLIAGDTASDIALLGVDAGLTPIEFAPSPELAQPACAIGNTFGLGLSVTCGVVSAKGVTNAGFNPVEDFIQTDAAINPGTSGGALIDMDGRLIGLVSAIFASDADANIGVNFAVSNALLNRVVDALASKGEVEYLTAGWRLGFADRAQLAEIAAPEVRFVQAGEPAETSGIEVGDLILQIGERRIQTPRDAVTALALLPAETESVPVVAQRRGVRTPVSLSFGTEPKTDETVSGPVDPECPHPEAVCRQRQAVFPISAYDPVASATRISGDLLVTNRHVLGDRLEAMVHTPEGPKTAKIVPSAFEGDLVLLKVEGLPADAAILELDTQGSATDLFFAVGADVARREIRVFEPGDLIMPPAEGAELGRLHVRAHMQPGVSGGALVGEDGRLTGIAVGGGDKRFEAIPVSAVEELLRQREDPEADRITRRLGKNFVACAAAIEAAANAQNRAEQTGQVAQACAQSSNHGQLLEAGRVLAQSGEFDAAADLHRQAVQQVPNSINSRLSLLVSLQLGARFEEMTEHARWLMAAAPDDPQALRFSIQSGVWGGDPALAEEGYQALLKADPRQAQAARRFIDAAPPRPARR
ncbi:trypsin-like peptidase domain-containing protein [Roseibium sp.]|uniref:trypsin-like peptidase domain-containing protein n=1 Tax=Roseibium sp. TaxID=1936156 RepID=UPI003B512F80